MGADVYACADGDHCSGCVREGELQCCICSEELEEVIG